MNLEKFNMFRLFILLQLWIIYPNTVQPFLPLLQHKCTRIDDRRFNATVELEYTIDTIFSRVLRVARSSASLWPTYAYDLARRRQRDERDVVSHDARDSAGACVSFVLAARQTDQCKRRLFLLRSLRGQDRNESLTSHDYGQGEWRIKERKK